MDPYLGSLRRECSKGMKGVSKVNESLALLASMANNDLTHSPALCGRWCGDSRCSCGQGREWFRLPDGQGEDAETLHLGTGYR